MVTIPYNALSGIQTQDLTICLYLNLKHGELDHSATMAGSKLHVTYATFQTQKPFPEHVPLCVFFA